MKKAILILMTCLSSAMLFSQTHWSPVSSGTSGSMVLIGKIQINGIDQTSDQLELGVFCGDECRGACIAHLFDFIQPAYYMVDPMVYGDAGNSYTFKLYDHGQNQELDLTSPEAITFTENGYGNVFTPYVLNFEGDATQTYTLPITGYGISTGGYYLIAPPFDNIDPATIACMTEGDFDLYYFDESQAGEEWRNYKSNAFNLESGRGYLYAHDTDVTLTFTGTPYSGDGQVPLAYTEGNSFAGWNLIGNPFDQIAYLADNRDFYVMKDNGGEIILSNTNSIQPMQGVFVVAANADDNTITFTMEMPTDESKALAIEIGKDHSAFPIDRATIRFGEGRMLPKFMLNESNTKVYLQQDNVNYAVVRSNCEGEIPVNFKAAENGTYTFSVNAENIEMDYLHLIDNMTGADIDLLQTSDYRFEAHTTDYASRFKLVFDVTTGIIESQDNFAYNNGNTWTISDTDNATLQVIDIMGRVIVSREGVHTFSTNGIASGVYVLRLIQGEIVKMQKIII